MPSDFKSWYVFRNPPTWIKNGIVNHFSDIREEFLETWAMYNVSCGQFDFSNDLRLVVQFIYNVFSCLRPYGSSSLHFGTKLDPLIHLFILQADSPIPGSFLHSPCVRENLSISLFWKYWTVIWTLITCFPAKQNMSCAFLHLSFIFGSVPGDFCCPISLPTCTRHA